MFSQKSVRRFVGDSSAFVLSVKDRNLHPVAILNSTARGLGLTGTHSKPRIVPSKTANNALNIRSISTGIRDRYTCFHLARYLEK